MDRRIRKHSTCMMIVLSLLFAVTAQPVLAYEEEIKLLSFEMAGKMSGAGKKTIAVMDFTDLQGNVTELGRFLAEEMSIALAESGKSFEVVDRNNLASILREHKLSASGIVDPATARRLGQISGVEALVMGSLTPFGDSIRLTVKILDTNTAKMLGSSRGNIAKIGAIEELFAKGISSEVGPAAAGSSAGSNRPAVNKKPAASQTQVVEANKFVFELQGCELSGQTVSCALAILNQAKDRNLTISHEATIFDDQGNSYRVSSGEIANTNQDMNWRDLEKTLLYGVPVRATLTFNGFSPQATSVTSLRLYATDNEKPAFNVDFRDISLDSKHAASIGAMSILGGAGPAAGGGAGSGNDGTILGTIKGKASDVIKEKAKSLLQKWGDKLIKPPGSN